MAGRTAAGARGGIEGGRLWLLLAAGLSAMVAIIFAMDSGVEGVRLAVRATARTSLALFLIAFTASALMRLRPGDATRWTLRNRRWFGLGFAWSHLLHLLAILWLFGNYAGQVPAPPMATVVGGGIAYVFIAAMAATSFDGAVRWMGAKNWQRLHMVGAWYIWIVFMTSYGKRAVVMPEYIPPVLLLIAAAALRIAARPRRTAA
ncbi:MAG: hypothetical protein J0H88_01060 [Sphingomonadales bacterium]|nr:hypothetical protein [Sphingomonadales bacterium]